MGMFNAASLSRTIDVINDNICKLVSWFTLFMALITLLIVILRYGFDIGWIAMQESVMYLHACVFLLGSAHTLRVNDHVRVDIFYSRFDTVKKAKIDTFGTLFFMLPVNLFIFIICWDYVASSWNIMEDSQAAGGLPAVFLLKTFILLFAALMVLQGISELIRNISVCLNHPKNVITEDK
ncbi:TRAP transporter small permease subunit [Aliiglaciecola sp. 2_MG-2023]|uniref:TRAP transporter small permease subunit n=1 Tax=unclassified Aliiglaciecola TaxID=2593648 RepID=UPI0026E32358|nr:MULTISPECIES: TRAP transporter small permease subunit [unclassified Aliiglaciecola]MDO6709491.1 TRAP transporter small permease subunit [Aliiglaciecola sp. 2_MG-2023]MDO6750967.1 TRAP transporter small permease subunit [Aliiglaciecola sp. 1_MG-2023]